MLNVLGPLRPLNTNTQAPDIPSVVSLLAYSLPGFAHTATTLALSGPVTEAPKPLLLAPNLLLAPKPLPQTPRHPSRVSKAEPFCGV